MFEATVGILVFVVTVAVVVAGVWFKRLVWWEILAVSALGVLGSVIIPNIRHIQNFVVQAGENQSVTVQMREVQQDIATKAQQVQTDTSEVRQLKEQIETIVKRLEKGEQLAQETDKKLNTVQQQQAPRRLSEEQKKILIEKLSPVRGQKGEIEYIWGDKDGATFAQDFKDAFREAGWEFQLAQATYTKDPVGIQIHLNEQVANADRVPLGAELLAQALIQVGLLKERGFYKNAKPPVGTILLRIGRKPDDFTSAPSPQ